MNILVRQKASQSLCLCLLRNVIANINASDTATASDNEILGSGVARKSIKTHVSRYHQQACDKIKEKEQKEMNKKDIIKIHLRPRKHPYENPRITPRGIKSQHLIIS